MKHLQKFERFFDMNDPAGQQPTYDLIYEFGKPKAIHCNICDMTSHNLTDIEKKYCANCNMFHDDAEDSKYPNAAEEKPMYPSDMYYGKGPSEELEEEEEDDDDEETNE